MNATFPCRRSWRLAALLTGLTGMLPAQAELMLHPTRVVMAKNERAAQVELINDSPVAASYRISIVNRRMSESGEFIAIDSAGPGEQFVGAMLSYSPRQVTLQPGSAQVVRLMVRRPEGLADGEYRSHLHFEKLPDRAGTGGDSNQQGDQIGVVLKTLIGASIPVIVRHGDTNAKVALTELAVTSAVPGQSAQLGFRIERSGNASVYGDLAARFTPHGGAEQVLARASGVAVYTPNTFRRAALSLKLPAGAVLGRGSLRLTFHERAEAGGKLLADAVLAVP